MSRYNPTPVYLRNKPKFKAALPRISLMILWFGAFAVVWFPEIRPDSIPQYAANLFLAIVFCANLLAQIIVECTNAPQ